ncbi:MAG TPA: 4-hydroxy-tetrahydrodipicolinate reductase [Thermomicrobiales bacterium]|nr:4-hydroxy-tetrahydrodipicolinate reductase [Thermomicrobiales bacterium]
MTTRIAVAGAAGRMGREVLAAAPGYSDLALVGAIVRPETDPARLPAFGDAGCRVVDDPAALAGAVDVMVDFTNPAATVVLADWCARAGVGFVSGTTGLSPEQIVRLDAAAARVPVFHARNMSPGIDAILRALPALLAALPGYDVEIVETHHRHKRDAPSGTALAIAETVAKAIEAHLPDDAVFGREGIAPRRGGEIGIHAVRGGGNPGEHAIVIAGDGEEIRLAHRSFGRRAYADGALRAARFVAGRPPGRYGMADLAEGEGGRR